MGAPATREDEELWEEVLDAFASPLAQSQVVLDFCEKFLDELGPESEEAFLEMVRKRAEAKAPDKVVYQAPAAVARPDRKPFPDAMLPDEMTEGPFDLSPYELRYFNGWRRDNRLAPLGQTGPWMLSEMEAGRLAELRGEA